MGGNTRGQQTEWEGHPGLGSGEVEQRGFCSHTDVAPCLAICKPSRMRDVCGYCCCWEGSFPFIAMNCNVPVKPQNKQQDTEAFERKTAGFL